MAITIKSSNPKFQPGLIENVERVLSHTLPEDYKQFLLASNGGRPETNEFDVPATKTGSGVNSFYGIINKPKDGDLLYEQRLFKDRLPASMIVIADAEGGNGICLSLRREDYGSVYFWDHELESEDDTGAALATLASSFDAFFSLLRIFDPKKVQLKPGQVKEAWINPELLKNLKKKG